MQWVKWSNKPWQYEYHQSKCRHRMIRAGNREGKTTAAMHDAAFHVTGIYPDWWEGHRFLHPPLIWVCSTTNEASRDIMQKPLIGDTDSKGEPIGNGLIPRHLIIGKPGRRQAGISEVIETVHVAWGGDRNKRAKIQFKAFEQGTKAFQGVPVDAIYADEEPDENNTKQEGIFSEMLARLVDTKGILSVTFTSLIGSTRIVRHFDQTDRKVKRDHIVLFTATWDDVPHLNEIVKAEALEDFPEHEVEARTMGMVMMGSGRVFTTPEAEIKVTPFEIPDHWFRICGIDYGFHHPNGTAWIAVDREADTWYVTNAVRATGQSASEHITTIKSGGTWIPVVGPHDGDTTEKSSGKKLYLAYADRDIGLGAQMLPKTACYPPNPGEKEKFGAQPVEPIIMEINERARTGRFKVFSNLYDFFDEYRNCHRDVKGMIVPRRDDILKATFYACMMQRYARQKSMVARTNAPRITRPMVA